MKLLWVLLVIQCASLSHTQGIAAGVCDDDWLSILVFTVTIQPSGSVVTTLGGDARFQCIPTTSQDNVQWLMNSSATLLNESIELGKGHPMKCTQSITMHMFVIAPEVRAVVCHMTDPTTGGIFYSLMTIIMHKSHSIIINPLCTVKPSVQ